MCISFVCDNISLNDLMMGVITLSMFAKGYSGSEGDAVCRQKQDPDSEYLNRSQGNHTSLTKPMFDISLANTIIHIDDGHHC